MKIKNPFVVSGAIPEQYFCDRVEESKQLVANIVNGRNTLLVSARRVGKTGLIEHCFAKPELRDDYYTFFVDILQTSSLQEFVYLLGSKIFETLRHREHPSFVLKDALEGLPELGHKAEKGASEEKTRGSETI